MPEVTCYIAELNVPSNVVLESNFTLQGKDISYYFQQASALSGGGAAIDLNMDSSQRHSMPPLQPRNMRCGVAVGAGANLQSRGAAGLQGSRANHCRYLHNVQLDAYGCMFDFDGQVPAYGPRQGCALFTAALSGAIQQVQGSLRDFQDFFTYTAIHELGHALNLWHVDTASFMNPAPDVGSFRQNLTFVDEEKSYMQHGADGDDALRFARAERIQRPWTSGPGDQFGGAYACAGRV